jgi:transcription elongation factor SPT5
MNIQDGSEQDIVFGIWEKSLIPTSNWEIASAFTRDSIKGSIYVEAPSSLAIANVIRGLSAVRNSNGKVLMELVPLEERTALLEMEKVPSTVRVGSWVEVKGRSIYGGDTALVREVTEEPEPIATILLVPRIPLDRKRKRGSPRPAPALFVHKQVEDAFGSDSLWQVDDYWRFNGARYMHGLLERKYPLRRLADVAVSLDATALEHFRQSSHPDIVDALGLLSAKLSIDDRVRVVLGQYKGVIGRIVAIEDNNLIDVQAENLPTLGRITVPVCEVHRKLVTGDYVEVLNGEHRGVEGFIVNIDCGCAVVYTCSRSKTTNDVHLEVRVQSKQELTLKPCHTAYISTPRASREKFKPSVAHGCEFGRHSHLHLQHLSGRTRPKKDVYRCRPLSTHGSLDNQRSL